MKLVRWLELLKVELRTMVRPTRVKLVVTGLLLVVGYMFAMLSGFGASATSELGYSGWKCLMVVSPNMCLVGLDKLASWQGLGLVVMAYVGSGVLCWVAERKLEF